MSGGPQQPHEARDSRSISALSVRRPIGAAMIYLAVVVLGIVSLGRIPVDLMPSVDAPRLSITTGYDGVAAQEIETLLTRPIEQAVSTISGVRRIDARSSEGISRITLRFDWGAELTEAVADVRAQLDRLGATLPEGADKPVVYKFDLSAFPVATLGVSSQGDPRRLRYLTDEVLARRIERVPGVASIQIRGGRVREIQVRLSAGRLAGYGLSPAQVVEALRRENRNVSGGDLIDDGRSVIVRTLGEFRSVDQIAGTIVAHSGTRPISVADLGEVVDTYRDRDAELWVNGISGVQLRVFKQDGANTVKVVEALREEIEKINADFEGVARLAVVWDGGRFVRQSIDNVTSSASWGAVLAVIVLLVYLRDLRATLVVAVTIPISVLATFALMETTGLSLNVVSFGGLALGIGMLVDNAIVLVESIHRRREEGQDAISAAIGGADDVAAAIAASTVTTTVVFVPVLFLGGFAGIFFREMALVVSFALLCSLFVALTLVPALSAQVLGRGREVAPGLVHRRYVALLERCLRRPWTVVALACLLLAATAGLTGQVALELMPESDEGKLDVSVELPVGTPIETTMTVMHRLERDLRQVVHPDEVASWMTFAGPEAWHRPGGSNQGSMEINLVPLSDGRRGIDEVSADVRRVLANVPGARVSVRKGTSNMLTRFMRGGSDDRLQVLVRGHDLGTARLLGEEVERELRQIDGIAFAQVERDAPQLERLVRIDRARVSELGLRGTDVAEAVETYLLGRVATRLRDLGGEFDVRVRLRDEERSTLDQLPALPVVAPDGRVVALSQVAELVEGRGPSSISRENQERILRVNAGVTDRALGDVVADVEEMLRGLMVPDTFQLEVGGEHVEQQEAFESLRMGLMLALFLVYAVMAVQFESVRDPLVIMAAVPFAFIGLVLALVLTATTLNMNSFLGGIVLVGIVVNNAILLVDTANRLRREEGMALQDAVRTSAARRLRPILMTTLTTVLAMVPLALGIGEGAEIQAPLARVVIGGLVVSTGVTLVLVPCLYVLAWRRSEAKAARAEAPPLQAA